MIVNLNWCDFHTRYFLDSTIFVKEFTTHFEFVTSHNNLIIRAIKEKENNEEDIIFVDSFEELDLELFKRYSFYTKQLKI